MLEIKNLKTGYGDRTVLDGISMQVAQGEILAVIGPNGAGKSTLIRAISGVIGHQGGGVNYLGEDILGISNLRRARILAVVPQARQVGGAFTVEQTVMMGRTPHLSWLGNPGEEDHAVVRQALEQTQISELAHRKNAELSGGEQQRVLLARALAQDTPVLLLDEPTNHLDLQHQVSFLGLVRDLTHEKGLAVLMAMHDLNHVSSIADHVALLVDGELVAYGMPGEVLTAETIEAAYNTPVQIVPNPVDGTPLVLPLRN